MASSIWVSTARLCEELGCSDKTLFRLRDDHYFRRNIHWRYTNPTSQRKTYRWHLARCKKKFEGKDNANGPRSLSA